MNKTRRKELGKVIEDLNTASKDIDIERCYSELDRIMSDEQDYFDNMPENLQGSMRGMDSEEAIDNMQEALELLEEALEKSDEERKDLIDEAIECIENAQF